MGAATFIENIKGTDYATTTIYGSWWFSLLWALLALLGVVYYFKSEASGNAKTWLSIPNWPRHGLHASLVIILVGAFITHISSRSGRLHLHFGDTMTMYESNEKNGAPVDLGFAIRLDTFNIKCYKGTKEPRDFVSSVTVTNSEGQEEKAKISMNHIYQQNGLRLYQMSYDPQDMSSILTVYDDPIGILTTYIGYGMLFLSFVLLMLKQIKGRSDVILYVAIAALLAWLIYYFNVRYMATHRVMPVLRTPFFGVHVGLMIVGYSLSAVIFLLSIAYLIHPSQRLTQWCHRLLIPALGFTAGGIFVGAIWANVSWGRYWGWDPKETWALISWMVYAVPLHAKSIPAFRKPRIFHLYLVVALLFIAFTYFGVNALLTGMHSYA